MCIRDRSYTELESSFIAEVMTVSDSLLWSTSTPITFAPFSCAAAITELPTAPPQPKITSVPFWYQEAAMD